MTRSHSYPMFRRQLVLWMAVLVALAGPAVAYTIAAQAALPGHTAAGAFTRFAIDGDLDGADDWAGGGYGPNTTDQGRRSVGIVDLVESTDACRQDPDDGYAGSIDGVPYPWPTTADAGPNDKTDICNIGVAYEVVEVDGRYHWVLYHYVARSGSATGDMSTVVVLDRVGQVEDTLIEFDFSPSSGTAPRKHVWNGSEWIASGLDSGFEVAVGANPFEPGANPGTFVELAVDLTANGLLPPAGAGGEIECGPFTVAGAASFTGNDANSSLKDRADFDAPISLSSCTDLLVTKQAVPAGISTSDIFTYRVDQADGQPSHNGTLEVTGGGEDVDGTDVSITSPVRVGETHTWTNVLAAPDYRLDELSLPDGWRLQDVECTWYDPFAGTTRTEVVTDGAGVLATFQVPPRGLDGGTPTACTITNETAGLVIAKTGSGDPAVEFTFEVTAREDQVLSLGESTGTLAFEPGTAVTLAESQPTQAPAWQARGVECRDGSDTVVATGAADSVEVTTVGGDVVTCTFTNDQQAGLVVAKTGEPAGSNQPFDFDWDVADADLDGTADFQLRIDGPAESSGDIAPGTYTVTELLETANLAADPHFALGEIACELTKTGDGGSTWSASVDDAHAVVTVAAGDVVTCIFTNVQAGRLVVAKETDGHDGTFAFSGVVEGTITTVDGATPAGEELAVDLPAGTYDVTEAVPAGWDLADASCDDGSGTLTDGEDAATLAGIELAAGEVVTCTFTNAVETAALTLTKDWGDMAEPGDRVVLTATGDDLNTSGPATGESTAPDTDDDAVLTVHAGEQVVLEEVHDPGNTGSYETFLACDPAGAGRLAYTAGDTSGTFTVLADDPADVTCTFLNERRTAQLTLQKEWIAGHPGDTATLTTTGSEVGTATSRATGGDQLDDTDTVVVEVLAGEVVDLAERLGDNTGTYTTSLACTDPSGLDWAEGERSATFTVPALPEDVTCTFTNTRTATDLTLTKTWGDPATGDAVELTVAGEAGQATGANAADGTVSDGATLTVYSGEVVALSEAFDAGDPDWYETDLSCDAGELAHDDGALVGSLAVTATDEPITCTFHNERETAEVMVVKELLPATDEGVFDLYVDGDLVVDDGGDGATSEPVTLLVGDPVAVGEMAGSGTDLDHYDAALECVGAELSSDTGTTGAFTMPAADDPVVCTFTNTRRSAALVLTKDWVDGAAGDHAVLAAAGDSGNSPSAAGSSTVLDGGTDAQLSIWAGETVTLSEELAATNSASYTASLACTDADGLTREPGDLAGTYTVPADPVDVTCTFTNTRTRVDLVLEKEWIAAAGDLATLAFTGQVSAPSNDSVATGVGGSELDTPVVVGEVLSGEVVAISELLDPANAAAYATSLACDDGELAHDPGESDADLVIPSDATDHITCRFTNTAQRGNIVVVKNVEGADGTFDFTADWTDPATGEPFGDFQITTDGGSGTLAWTGLLVPADGSTYALEEVDPAPEYDGTRLVCVDPDEGSGVDGLAATIDLDPGETVTCTYTNTQRATITVVKDAVPDDDQDFTFVASGGILDETFVLDDDASFASSPDPDARPNAWTSSLLPAGGTHAVVEQPVEGWSLAGASCDNGDGPDAIGIEPGANVTCTFVNEAAPGGIEVTKVVTGVPDDHAWSFEIAIDPADAAVDSPQVVSGVGATSDVVSFAPLALNATYTIFEPALPAGWEQASLACDLADVDPLADGHQVTITEPDQSIGCTITNVLLPPAGVEADLAVTKTGTTAVTLPAEGGSATVAYTVTVSNHGPDAAADVVVTDVLPDQVILESVTPEAGACAVVTDGFTCELGTLAAGAVVTIEVITTTVAGVVAGAAVNVVEASSSTPDPVASNNRDDHVTTIARALPRTGADLGWLALLGLLMVLAGAATTRVGRALAAEGSRLPGA